MQLFFFTIVVTPYSFTELKLAIILIMISKFIISKKYFVKYTVYWFVYFVTISSIFILYGIYNNNPGAYDAIEIYVIYPIFYLFLISYIKNFNILKKLIDVLMISSIFIFIYISLFAVSVKFGFFNQSIFGMASVVLDASTNGNLKIFAPFITSLMFIIPLNITLLLDKKQNVYSKKFLFIILIMNLISAYFAQRDALYLVIFLSFTLISFSHNKIRKQFRVFLKNNIIFFIIGIMLMFYFSEYTSQLFDKISLGFDFSSVNAKSAYQRYLQFYQLLNGWSKQPFFGTGFGGVLQSGFIRNKEYPWAFELSYLALLFHTGIIGIISYLILFIYSFKKILKIINQNFQNSALYRSVYIGTLSALIATATNPYLFSFDNLWMLFAPLSIVNIYYIEKKEKYEEKNYNINGNL